MSSILTKFKTQGQLNNFLGYWNTVGGQSNCQIRHMSNHSLEALLIKQYLKESTLIHSQTDTRASLEHLCHGIPRLQETKFLWNFLSQTCVQAFGPVTWFPMEWVWPHVHHKVLDKTRLYSKLEHCPICPHSISFAAKKKKKKKKPIFLNMGQSSWLGAARTILSNTLWLLSTVLQIYSKHCLRIIPFSGSQISLKFSML
jgi:hypothetical protein